MPIFEVKERQVKVFAPDRKRWLYATARDGKITDLDNPYQDVGGVYLNQIDIPYLKVYIQFLTEVIEAIKQTEGE